MEEKRPPLAVVALVLLLVIPSVYVGSYLLLSRKGELPEGTRYRSFPAKWQAHLYNPLIDIEAFVMSERIGGVTYHENGAKQFRYRNLPYGD
jgi:hypothetical protein